LEIELILKTRHYYDFNIGARLIEKRGRMGFRAPDEIKEYEDTREEAQK
jgi:hypothetical protein